MRVAAGAYAKFAVWVAPVWMAGIGWRYLPLIADNAGQSWYLDEVCWPLLWAVCATAVLVSVALDPKRAALGWRLLMVSTAGLIVIRSGVVLEALAAAWLLSLSILVGDRIVTSLGLEFAQSYLERLTVALAVGVVVLALVTLGLAASHLLAPAYVWGLVLGLTVAESRHALSLARQLLARWKAPASAERERAVLQLLTGLVMLANLASAVAPELAYDGLNYHLAVPRLYLEAGGLTNLSYFWHSYFAHLAELFYTLGMAIGGAMTAKMTNLVLGAASMAAVYCLGALVFTRRVGLWAAALYYTTPLTDELSATTYTDLTVALFLTLAIIALIEWRRSMHQGWLVTCGVFAGSAIGVKLNAAYAAIGLGLTLTIILARLRTPVRDRLRAAALFAALAAATAIPWYIPAYIYTGNPVFPLLNGVFKSPLSEPVNGLMDSRSFGIGTAPNALIELPARLTFNPRFGTPPGTLGVLALLCAPFGIVLLLRRNTEIRMLGLIAAVYMVAWVLTFQYARYYLPVLPIVAVLAVAGILSADPANLAAPVTRTAMLLLLVLQSAAFAIHYDNSPQRFPIRLALGLERREAFLDRALTGYSAVQYINRNIRPGQRVLGIETEHLRFYLNPPIDALSEAPLNHPLRRIGGTDSEVARSLAEAGYAYLLVTQTARAHPAAAYLQAPFLEDFAVLEYEGGGAAVYRLKQPIP